MTGDIVLSILLVLLRAYSFVIFARIILSLFTAPTSGIMRFLVFLTEPLLAPIRKLLEPMMRNSTIPLDLSPLIAWLLISVIMEILIQIF